MKNLYPLLFEANLHTVVWGGERLRPYKGMAPSDEPIGESWEVSAVPTSTSIVRNGVWKGRDLISVINEQPEAILGKKVNEKYHGQLPLLVKFIDAKRDLSIQVHPNDEMAMREHGKMGKSEMWYVIKADAGAHLYAGFKKEIQIGEYYQRVADGTITEVLADHQVKAGDVFYLPAGRVHAICGGILLAEVQQSSDVTYRIFDYNRPGLDGKPRELHIDKAVDVTKTWPAPPRRRRPLMQFEGYSADVIADCQFFTTTELRITEEAAFPAPNGVSYTHLLCTEGDAALIYDDGVIMPISKGESVFLPANFGAYTIRSRNCTLLSTQTLPRK